jgi:hypothetical protein
MSNIPDRATARPPVKMRKQNCDRDANPQCGNCMKCKINADIAASGVPDDTELTGTKPLRKKPVLEGEKDSEVKKLYGKE